MSEGDANLEAKLAQAPKQGALQNTADASTQKAKELAQQPQTEMHTAATDTVKPTIDPMQLANSTQNSVHHGSLGLQAPTAAARYRSYSRRAGRADHRPRGRDRRARAVRPQPLRDPPRSARARPHRRASRRRPQRPRDVAADGGAGRDARLAAARRARSSNARCSRPASRPPTTACNSRCATSASPATTPASPTRNGAAVVAGCRARPGRGFDGNGYGRLLGLGSGIDIRV